MSLRLFQIMAGARHGGAEAFFTRLAVALQDVGLDQQVAVRPHPERLATLRHAGIPVLTMRFGGPLDLMTGWRLERAVRTYAPQIVLAWMSRAASFTPAGGHLRLARLGGYYNIKYYRGFDHLIGNTRDIVDYIIRSGWEPGHVHYLPNFVELTPEPPIARAALCTPEEAPLVLALGRLHRNKAFDVLIEAMNRLDGVYLWLAGEGSERKALEDQVRHHGLEGRVRFLGWRSDISALLAAADVLVCPSRHEPLGNVVLEGWAAGKPVVAAASTGPASLITEGKTGLLVPVEDAEALAAALHCVTGDRALAADLGKGGFAAYEAGYTKEAVVAEYTPMCGIAGIAGRPDTNPDPRRLDAMRRALAHRGPDGVDQETVGQVRLVHTRLAIIDLVTGDQPVGRKNLIWYVMRQDRTRDVARRVRISR